MSMPSITSLTSSSWDIEGLDHPKRMFDLTEGLVRRKYTDRQIEGILGGNFRRVLTDIWTTQPAAP